MTLTNPSALVNQLVDFLRQELAQRGFKKVVVGLSGGVDSAVVARLCQEAIGENLHALLMPSSVSSKESVEHALLLCERFNLSHHIQSIAPLELAFRELHPEASPLRIGNACARFRMITLYDFSFKENRLVIGTGNKSEILLGYGTLYGDTACALNPIGDLYKTEIFQLAKFLSIPDEIIQKAPSADLFEGQSDEKELGFSYNDMDQLLFDHIELKLSKEELLAKGHAKELVEMVLKRISTNKFKSEMPPIAQVRGRL